MGESRRAKHRAAREGMVFGPLTVVRYEGPFKVQVRCVCGALSWTGWQRFYANYKHRNWRRCLQDFDCRFWFEVDRDGDGCWRWQGAVDDDGYGVLHVPSKGATRTHRVSWWLTNGEIPGEAHVLHSCDAPLCVNPGHLRLGTHADNMKDKADRGRSKTGRRFKEAEVLAIRRSSLKVSDLAETYAVSPRTIRNIRARRTWKHISPEAASEDG
jgi:hypothetical protein